MTCAPSHNEIYNFYKNFLAEAFFFFPPLISIFFFLRMFPLISKFYIRVRNMDDFLLPKAVRLNNIVWSRLPLYEKNRVQINLFFIFIAIIILLYRKRWFFSSSFVTKNSIL